MDAILNRVRAQRHPKAETVVAAHTAIVKLFRWISGHGNPSLASKYLHFHCPRAAYICDSRALTAIRRVTEPVRLPSNLKKLKNPYASFFMRCEVLKGALEKLLKRKLKPRDVDKVLLAVYEQVRA